MDYERYLEPCAICDSDDTVIMEEVMIADDDTPYVITFIHCNDCEYEFVNRDLYNIIMTARFNKD